VLHPSQTSLSKSITRNCLNVFSCPRSRSPTETFRCPFRDHPSDAERQRPGGHEREAAGDERAAGPRKAIATRGRDTLAEKSCWRAGWHRELARLPGHLPARCEQTSASCDRLAHNGRVKAAEEMGRARAEAPPDRELDRSVPPPRRNGLDPRGGTSARRRDPKPMSTQSHLRRRSPNSVSNQRTAR
jgi:hypothetical protein